MDGLIPWRSLSILRFSPEVLPSVVVFNPHKRLRFTKLEVLDITEGADLRYVVDELTIIQ